MSSFRRRLNLAIVIAAAVSGLGSYVAPAVAMDASTPDWPCVWRKVMEIDAAAIWDGPSIDTAKDWQKDETVRNLSAYIISRRLKPEEAEAAIKKYAESVPEASRDQKLTELFTGSLSRTNDERKIVMNGIERFHKRQLARAKELESQGMTLPKQEDVAAEAMADATASESPAGTVADAQSAANDPQEKFKWEVRVFQERQKNIPVACEIPQLMDERIGLVARAIRALMKS
jgi:hypothetical protein